MGPVICRAWGVRLRGLLAVLAGAALAAAAGTSDECAAQEADVAPVGTERLVARDGSRAIRLVSQRVTAVVEDGLARTTVRQSFRSAAEAPLEAVWTFPVPDGAALVDVAMETDGKRFEGLLAERRTARRAYDSLVRRNIDPALVEQVGRNAFRMSVFPVVRDKETVVECTWVEACPLVRGEHRYVYPLALAGGAAATERDFTFSLTLRSSAPVVSCASDAPGILVTAAGPTESRASFERTGAKLDRDIVVTARVAAPEASLAVKTWRSPRGETWYAAVVTPPDVPVDRTLPRDVTLVLDTSGSMDGQKMEQARSAALWLIDNLRARDRANVIVFSSELARFAVEPVPADEANREKLRALIGAVHAAGGTALGDAVRAASEIRPAAGRVGLVVLVTDGRPTAGLSAPAEICALARKSGESGTRIFTFGVGADVDGALVEGIATAGRGAAEIFREGGETESRLRQFLSRTASPVMGGLVVTVNGAPADDLYPRDVRDLYLGEQAVLTGRLPAGADASSVEVSVRGVIDGRAVELRAKAPVTAAGGASIVRDVYARQNLAYLGQAARLRAGLSDDAYFAALDRGAYSTGDEIVRAMIDLSIDSGVQCPYTSFLVLLPEDRARLDPRNLAELEAAESRAREAQGIPPRPAATTSSAPEQAEDPEPLRDMERAAEDPVVSDASEADRSVGPGDPADPTRARGHFGSRGFGRRAPDAVDLGLSWIAAHANPDGGFGDGTSDAESTGLALLAFLGAGETHQAGTHKDVVRAAARWLRDRQDADGCFAPRAASGWMRRHLIAALAMSEIYGMTQSPLFRESAARGVNFALAARVPGGGWGAGYREGAEDPVLTAYGVLLFQTAVLADLVPDKSALRDLVSRPALTKAPETPKAAAALALARILTTREDPSAAPPADLRLLLAAFGDRTPRGDAPGIDDEPEYVWIASLAAHNLGGDAWKPWLSALEVAVARTQRGAGAPDAGRWDPRGGASALATTSYHCVALQTRHRHSRAGRAAHLLR